MNDYSMARGPDTSIENFRMLTEHPNIGVRWAVLYNSNTPIEILEKLTKDFDYRIRREAINIIKKRKENNMWEVNLARDATVPKVLRDLALSTNVEVRCEVARNPSTHPTTIDDLAKDKDKDVRYAAFNNPSISSETLIYFVDKGLPTTSSMAVKMLQQRQDSGIDFKYNSRKEFDMKKFYLVVQASCRNVKGAYTTKEEATESAKKLAAENSDVYVVMEPMFAFRKPAPAVEQVELED